MKYLPGWNTNQQVPCISIVDYATSLHVMAPIFHRETAEVTKGVLRDSWVSWAGVPHNLELDPSSSNLSEMLGEYCENMGINVQHIAADSHWQLGKVERHGHWFAKIFERVCDECQPTSAEEFVDCVMQTQVAKTLSLAKVVQAHINWCLVGILGSHKTCFRKTLMSQPRMQFLPMQDTKDHRQ